MSRYGVFSRFYDILTQNVDYPARAELLDRLIRQNMTLPPRPILLDLACGTGSLSALMAAQGYDVIGVDASPDMLSIAAQKLPGTLFLCQEMQKLDLYGTVDVTVCLLDSLNHLPSERALDLAIGRVSLFTAEGGLFLFDINTAHKHRVVLGDNAFVYDTGELFCTWQNRYTARNDAVEITLDFFVPNKNGAYERFSERFTERIFEDELLRRMLEKHCFEVIGIYGDAPPSPPARDCQRVLYVARRISCAPGSMPDKQKGE